MTFESSLELKAIASAPRLAILSWLRDPFEHFPPGTQIHGDLLTDGVCALLICRKLGLAQPTTARHLRILVDAGLLVPKRIKKWTYYRRDEAMIEGLKRAIDLHL